MYCSTLFHCFLSVMDLLAHCVEELLDHGFFVGTQVEPPTGTKSCTFFCSTLLSRRHLSTGPMEFRGSPCKAPRSVLEATITSSRCPRKENHLNGNLPCQLILLQPTQGLIHYSLDLSCCHLGFILQLLLVQIVASMNNNSCTALGLNLGLVGLASLVRMVVLYSMN